MLIENEKLGEAVCPTLCGEEHTGWSSSAKWLALKAGPYRYHFADCIDYINIHIHTCM